MWMEYVKTIAFEHHAPHEYTHIATFVLSYKYSS